MLFHQWQRKPHHEKAKSKNCAVKALSYDIAVNGATAYAKPCKKVSHDIAVSGSANRIMKKRFFTNDSRQAASRKSEK